MPRLPRNSRRFDLVEVLAAVGQEMKIPLTDASSEPRFKSAIESDLKVHGADKTLFLGKRTEEMFGYIAAALGKCLMVKKEDAGGFVRDDDIRIPDYRLFLEDGREYLVEVKNRHIKAGKANKFVATEKYVAKLRRYADLCKKELRFAIYWSNDNVWTLVSPESMKLNAGQYEQHYMDSFIASEMGVALGDAVLITPEPLVYRIIIDPAEPSGLEKQGNSTVAKGTALKGEYYSAGRLIEDEFEQKIANFLFDNGPWVREGRTAELAENGTILYLEETCRLRPKGDADFSMLGPMSSMLTWEYLYQTSTDGGLSALTPDVEPENFGVRIPDGFVGKYLDIQKVIVSPGIDPGKTDGDVVRMKASDPSRAG